eukprot:scaffold481269_cov25-Prasinocladus_malaysianus.AAC.1
MAAVTRRGGAPMRTSLLLLPPSVSNCANPRSAPSSRLARRPPRTLPAANTHRKGQSRPLRRATRLN